jgi:anti-sigma B factor antagonist
MLTTDREDRADLTVLRLGGQLDALNAATLEHEAAQLLDAGRVRVVLDLAGLHLVDSAGVGAIVSLFKKVRSRRGDVKIAALAGQPREIFKLLNLDKAFDLQPSVEAASARFEP